MKQKPWRETQPLLCEVCECCEYVEKNRYLRYLICRKYDEVKSIWDSRFYSKETLNHSDFERLHEDCKCKQNYPSFWRRFRFRLLCWLKYREDKKYHRLEE